MITTRRDAAEAVLGILHLEPGDLTSEQHAAVIEYLRQLEQAGWERGFKAGTDAADRVTKAASRHFPLREGRTDHRLCSEDAHDRSMPDNWETVPQEMAADGLLGCNDCGKALFYCRDTEWYAHCDPLASCFLHGAWGS